MNVDSQLFLQVLLPGLAGFGLTLSSQHLTLSSSPQTGAGLGLVGGLGQVLLQDLDVVCGSEHQLSHTFTPENLLS